jgi:translation initiation factor 1 (eIF-1/SUI1)
MRVAAAGVMTAAVLLVGCGGTTPTVSRKDAEELAAKARSAIEAVHISCAKGQVRLEVHAIREVNETCVKPEELAAQMKRRCPKGAKTTRAGNHVKCLAGLNEAIRAVAHACPKGDMLVGVVGGPATCMTQREAEGR